MVTKAKNGKRPAREKKPKQKFLEGMEPPSIPELDQAADNYYDVMEERVGLTKEEDQAKDSLLGKMKEHQLDRYETASGKIVSVINSSKLKVKKKKEPKADIELNGDAA